MPNPVTVIRDGKISAAGFRDGDAVVYDWGFSQAGVSYVQRSFVLLDVGFQLSQPAIFPPPQRGWWYCDLVRVVDEEETVYVYDNWIDVIVGPPDHPYRVLDIDAYAEAIASGLIGASEGVDGLRRTQWFLDRHLNRRHDTRRDSWPDFPPAALGRLAALVYQPRWILI